MGWLIALAAVAGLLMIRLGISAVYSADGPVVKLTFGPYRRTLYPAAKKEKKKAPSRNSFFDEVELSLNNSLGRKAKVITKNGKEGGTLEIAFFDKDDLARIANILSALE